MVCWLRLHQSNSWAEGRTQVGKQRFPHAFWRGWGEIWPQYTEAQFRQGGLEGSQEQLEGQVVGAGGLRALSPSGPEGCEVSKGTFRGAGSPEAAACAQQGRRLRRRAPELSRGAGGTRAASRRGGGTGRGRPSSRDRLGSEQSQGEALRRGGAPGVF